MQLIAWHSAECRLKVKTIHFTGGLLIAQRLYNYPISDLGAKRSITGITTFLLYNNIIVKINGLTKMHLYIQVERSLYCIYRRRNRIHVSIYIYTVDLQLETITQILLCKRQPGCSVKKSIYKCEIKDGKDWCWSYICQHLFNRKSSSSWQSKV